MIRHFRLILLFFSVGIVSACNPFAPKEAGLQVMTNDIASQVYLNGVAQAATPYVAQELEPGSYTLKIVPEDPQLVPYETNITLRSGLLTVVTWKPGDRPETSGGVIYELEKLASTDEAALTVSSLPDGVIVGFDDLNKEQAPIALEGLTPGHHQLELTLPSYESQAHTVNLIAGHRLHVTVKLAKSLSALGDQPPGQVAGVTLSSPAPIASESAFPSLVAQPATPGATTTQQPDPKAPYVVINQTNFFVEGKEVLRVRDQVGASGKELGVAPVGSKYAYLQEEKVGWYKISFNGQEGWVSGQYATLVSQD